MPHPFEQTLDSRFRETVATYISTFPRSHIAGGFEGDIAPKMAAYADLIRERYLFARARAASELNGYLNRYGVQAKFNADEFKLIYFMGRAITYQLRDVSYDEIAQIHQIAMLGLMDYRLRTLGIRKDKMLRALAKLVRTEVFDSELGATGCYLLYKCVSTTSKDGPI